jgi:transcriptional regulator with XRE-family HTH domain
MTQKDVSEHSGISILTINKFENGTIGKMSFATFIALIKAIGYIDNLDHLLPALPESPYLYNDTKKVQRVRHKRK